MGLSAVSWERYLAFRDKLEERMFLFFYFTFMDAFVPVFAYDKM